KGLNYLHLCNIAHRDLLSIKYIGIPIVANLNLKKNYRFGGVISMDENANDITKVFGIPDYNLILHILRGNRPKPSTLGTSESYNTYSNLYKQCWAEEPSERPAIKSVVDT
ncbi:14075_t:CDS:2, partial [Funneliformis mosseae]